MAQKKLRISIPNSFFIWRISIFFSWRISIPNSFLVWRISIPNQFQKNLGDTVVKTVGFSWGCTKGSAQGALGYWSSKLKMSLGYWSSKRKRYWSSKWKMSLGYWSSAFFGPFCRGRFFFSRPVGRVPIKFFFCRGCQNLSRFKRVDYITSVFTHRSRRFRKLPSKTWPLWPDTLYTLSSSLLAM